MPPWWRPESKPPHGVIPERALPTDSSRNPRFPK